MKGFRTISGALPVVFVLLVSFVVFYASFQIDFLVQ